MMMKNLAKIPLSDSEVQSILGISKQSYDELVSSNDLKKSLSSLPRNQNSSLQHCFFDLLAFLLRPRYDEWNWLLGDGDLGIIVKKIHELDGCCVGRRVSGVLSAKLTSDAADLAKMEVNDELRKIVVEIEAVWDWILNRIYLENDKAQDKGMAFPDPNTGTSLKKHVTVWGVKELYFRVRS